MATEEAKSAWAQLVSTTDTETEPSIIRTDKFTIGRAKVCDLSLSENKLVSGRHCYIERDRTGKVWLYDTSTNGTLLNQSEKITKGEFRELNHGDEFYIVYKKNSEELNVGYMYQDLAALRREEADATRDYSSDLDATLLDTEVNEAEDSRKRTQSRTSVSQEPAVKRRKTEEEEVPATPEDLTSAAEESDKQEEITDKTDVIKSSGKKTDKPEQSEEELKVTDEKVELPEKDEIEETLLCIICQEILHDCISLQPCMHSFCAGCYSGWMKRSNECPSCRMKVERVNKNHMVNNLVQAYLKEHPEKRRPEEDIKELEAKNTITRDMLYPRRPRRYSDGSDVSDDEEEEMGSEDEGPVMAAFGHAPAQVGGGMLFGLGAPVFGTVRNIYNMACGTLQHAGRAIAGMTIALQGQRPIAIVCRQCPGYVEPPQPATGGGDVATPTETVPLGAGLESPEGSLTGVDAERPSTSSEPSTSGGGQTTSKVTDDKVLPTPPPYNCMVNQNHVLCACCFQPMPDRRHEHMNNPAVPPISCIICYRNYCHAYWGCRKADCLGCFSKFGDMNFGKKCLTNLILDNPHESQILADYLDALSLSIRDVVKSCMTKMERGEYICPDQARYNITSQTWLCYPCALKNFKSLAYYYRRDISRDQLPAAVTSRSDCYWGKNCRTQRNKPHHAQRFNHICDQSRTT